MIEIIFGFVTNFVLQEVTKGLMPILPLADAGVDSMFNLIPVITGVAVHTGYHDIVDDRRVGRFPAMLLDISHCLSAHAEWHRLDSQVHIGV